MLISKLKLQNWRNFRKMEVALRERVFVIGPNASGKSNLLDVFRFLRDVAQPNGGGLQRAINDHALHTDNTDEFSRVPGLRIIPFTA